MGSIKISKLGCKIMSGLTACVIGLSPCLGTQVFAAPVFIRSIKQSKEIEDCSREELIESLPDLWSRLLMACYAAWNTTKAAADAAACSAIRAATNAAGNAAYDAAWDVAYDSPVSVFANTWRPDGAAYVIVQNNDRAYFENLVRVLEEQIVFVEDSTKSSIPQNVDVCVHQSQPQDQPQESRERLLERTPELWSDLYNAYDEVRVAYSEVCDDLRDDAWSETWDDIWNDIWEAVRRNGSYNQVYDAASQSLSDKDFVATWKSGGKVYNLIIQHETLYDTKYLINLEKTLKEKTDLLRDQTIFLQHLVSKKKLIESLPGFLERFNVAMNDCKVVDVKNGAQAAVNIALSAAKMAPERVPVIMCSCAANNWKPGGSARKMFKNESIDFFKNLVRVLEEQIVFLDQVSRERLLERIPDLWQRLWTAYDAANDADEDTAKDTANDADEDTAKDTAKDAAYDAAGDAANDAAGHAARGADGAAWNAAFANAWGRGGAAYKIVKDKDRAYFENLANVLEEQIAILEDIANQNRH